MVEEADQCNVSHDAIFSDSASEVSLERFSAKYTKKNHVRKIIRLKKPHKNPYKDNKSKAASDSNIEL